MNLILAMLLTWSPPLDADVAGYRVYGGPSIGDWSYTNDVGNVLAFEIPADNEGLWWGVTAYDHAGNESVFAWEHARIIYIGYTRTVLRRVTDSNGTWEP